MRLAAQGVKKRGPPMSQALKPIAKSLAELIAGSIDPLVKKRGLARAELLSWWPDIVGEAYAGRTVPERIRWPRDGTAAVLFIRCDPSLALQLSYETEQVRQRLNSYFGYPAVGAVRIVQHPVGDLKEKAPEEKREGPLPQPLEERLGSFDEPLRDSLRNLARKVLART
jgi:hypothetical protein